jgi:hypothetical protein
MKNRSIMVAAATLAATAGSAMAQHAFPVFNPAPSAVTNVWSSHNLGAAPAGSYSTYLVMLDWFNIAPGNGWSNEARSTLSSTPANANTLTTPSYADPANVVYGNNLTAPIGSVASIADRANIYWTGNLANPYAGGTDFHLNFRQSFNSTNMNWENVRVVLDPIINTTTDRNHFAVPTAFTDLGTQSVGGTNLSVNVPAGAGAWFRFGVDANVNNAAGNAFDMFTSGGVDTRMHVFRESANGLVPIATTDDIGAFGGSPTNFNGAASFGSDDADSNGRDTYGVSGVGGPFDFDGRGGRDLPANIPSLTNTPGAGSLDVGESYWVWVGFWSGTALGVSQSNIVSQSGAVTFDITNKFTENFNDVGSQHAGFTLELRSIPTPGAFALLGLGGLVATRRRRA